MTYPFASLSSGLLARKGAAQPAMTSHGGGSPLRMAIREEARPHSPFDDSYAAGPVHRAQPQPPLRPNGHGAVEELPAVAPAAIPAVAPASLATAAPAPISSVAPAPVAPITAPPAYRPQAPSPSGHTVSENLPPPVAPAPVAAAPAQRAQLLAKIAANAPVHNETPVAAQANATPAFRPQTVLARAGFVFESGPPPVPSAPRTDASLAAHNPRAVETGGGCGSSGSCGVADAVAADPTRRFHVSVRLKQSHFVRLKIASALLKKPSQDIVGEALGMFFRSLDPAVFGDCACARES